MNPWVESLVAVLLAAGGVLIGAWFSRQKYWVLGYLMPLVIILTYTVASRKPTLSFVPPISWMLMSRSKFAIMGFVATMVLTTPMMKLPRKRDRVAVSVIMAVVTLAMSVWPVLAPVFSQKQLASLTTKMDADGICLQTTDYTCGPASAATALRKLGIQAQEGEIGILASTASATGTPPDILADALRKRYERDGLVCEYRAFKSVTDLRGCGSVMALTKYNLIMDHYMTVLKVDDHEVTVGDPRCGICRYSYAEFADKWRFVGIVISRRVVK